MFLIQSSISESGGGCLAERKMAPCGRGGSYVGSPWNLMRYCLKLAINCTSLRSLSCTYLRPRTSSPTSMNLPMCMIMMMMMMLLSMSMMIVLAISSRPPPLPLGHSPLSPASACAHEHSLLLRSLGQWPVDLHTNPTATGQDELRKPLRQISPLSQ